jgi:Ner family transcriptional regulator
MSERTLAQKNAALHPEMIKAELRLRYGSLTRVAKLLEISLKSVSGAIRYPGLSVRTEGRIAKLLERPAYEIWPDRYTAEGEPRRRAYTRRRRGAAS